MIVTGKQLLAKAKEGGYAVPALNVDNLESVLGVLRAVEETGKSVIIQTIPRTLAYGGTGTYIAMIRALYKGGADICVHLDHGGDEEICKKCIQEGYTSVMIDGSALPYEENVKLTSRVAANAHNSGVSVEGELGTIGGKEETSGKVSYTDPYEARDFAQSTKVDSLAVGVGTAHGVYKGTPHIAVERIEEIASLTPVPLVLHGASSVIPEYAKTIETYGGSMPGAKGVPEDLLRKAASMAVCKINIDSDLRMAFTAAVRKHFAENPSHFDPRQYLTDARALIKECVKHKLVNVLGCNGKA